MKGPEGVCWRVGPAEGKGMGLFARRDLQPGEGICGYRGPVVTPEEWEARPEGERGDNRTLFALTPGLWVDGAAADNPGRWINHSCRPNAEAIPWALPGSGDGNPSGGGGADARAGLQVRALRLIAAGEEVTLDYGYTPVESLAWPCRCGAAECPGYPVGAAWRADLRRLLRSLRRGGGPRKGWVRAGEEE